MSIFAEIIAKATPLECTMPDGTVVPFDNPLGGLPFLSDVGKPDGCIDGPSIASQATDAVFGPGSFKEAAAGFVRTVSTFWLSDPSPTVVNSDYQLNGTAGFIDANTTWYTMFALVVAIVIVGAKIAWQQRANGFDHILQALLPFILVTGVGGAVVATALEVGDAYSPWVIEKASSGGFADNLNAYLISPDATNALGVVGSWILLGAAALAALVQMLLMLARGGALVIMVGLWGLSAAASGLEHGKIVFTTFTSWIIAFVLYKPAAATVYAGAFSLMGTPGTDADPVRTVAQGVVLMVLAVLTLPALLKILAPITTPVAGGGAGGYIAGGAAGAAALSR